MNLKLLILFTGIFLSGVKPQTPVTSPACSSLPLVTQLDYPVLASFSPFTTYQTNDLETFKCSKCILMGPAAGFSNYTGSVIIIRGNYTSSINYVFKDGIFMDQICSSDLREPYRLIYLNLKSSNEAGYCVAVCDGIAFKSFVCVGRGIEAYNNFQKFINESMAGVPGIVNANNNCEKPQDCAFFTN